MITTRINSVLWLGATILFLKVQAQYQQTQSPVLLPSNQYGQSGPSYPNPAPGPSYPNPAPGPSYPNPGPSYPNPGPAPYPNPGPAPNPYPAPNITPVPFPATPQPYQPQPVQPQPQPQTGYGQQILQPPPQQNYGQVQPQPQPGSNIYQPQPQLPQPSSYFPRPQPSYGSEQQIQYPATNTGGGYGGNSYPSPGPAPGGYVGGNSGADTSDPCFRKYSNCIIVNAQPYERRSKFTVEQCKELCKQSTTGTYTCRSFVYDNQNQVCDLFAHTGNQYPARLLHYVGRDYYEPTGNCAGGGGGGGGYPGVTSGTSTPGPGITTAQPVTTAPSTVDQCVNSENGANTVSRFAKTENHAVSSSASRVPNQTEQQCKDACIVSPTCAAFNYFRSQRECQFLTETEANPVNNPPDETGGADFLFRLCVDEETARRCTEPFFIGPGKILVGFAETVTDADSFEECLSECLNSQDRYGFSCQSGMFYSEEADLNCILNTEDKETQPDLYSDEADGEPVTYFQPNCRTRQTVQRYRNRRARNRLRGAVVASIDEDVNVVTLNRTVDISGRNLPAFGEWTQWSPCDREQDGRRTRYRQCELGNLKKCPFQSEWCSGDDEPTKFRKKDGAGVQRFAALKEAKSERKSTDRLVVKPREEVFTLDYLAKFNETSSFPCPAGVCCPITPGSCRIGMEISVHDGKPHYCTNPCNL